MIFATDGITRTQGPGRFSMVLMVAFLLSLNLATKAESVLPEGSSVDTYAYLGMLGKLAIVLAVIVACGWLLRRLQRVQLRTSKQLEVVDVLALGPKERILLVRAGEQQLLLGSTPGQLRTLHRFDQPLTFKEHQRLQLAEPAA